MKRGGLDVRSYRKQKKEAALIKKGVVMLEER